MDGVSDRTKKLRAESDELIISQQSTSRPEQNYKPKITETAR